jgi:AraC family transcriptional regulator of arabinose operon
MDHRVQLAIVVIKNNLHQDGAFDEAADFVNLSPSRLRHLFTSETGVSPAQYLRTLRMDQARQLLESTWLSVLQIVLRVGLQDRSHFEQEFKRIYGLTPAQHRTNSRFTILANEAGSIAGSATLQPQRTHNSRNSHKKAIVPQDSFH